MSCFWDTLIKKINTNDIKTILKITNIDPKTFSNALKNENIKTNNVLWKGGDVSEKQSLSEKQKTENFDHIKEYDINTIKNGYLCSTFDPFLILICELFNIDIHHKYNGHMIIYEYKDESKYQIYIENNSGHMW